MSLNNQEKFVNSFWVIILLVAVGIYFWVIPKNSIAEAYSKKKHYNLKKTSRFLAVGFWIIAISCVPVLISLWFDTPWICIICVIQTGRNRLAFVFVQRDQPCCGHPKSPP